MICEICGHEYITSCMRCTKRVMTWGEDGTIALMDMAKRTDDIHVQELVEFVNKYYIGKTKERCNRVHVLRIALRVLDYKGNFIGRIHLNKTDCFSTRKREYASGRRWRLRKDVCEKCGGTQDLRLHHIVPISWRGHSSEENCVTLCKKCHEEVHRKLAKYLNRDLLLEYLKPHEEEIKKMAFMAYKDV